MSVLLSDQSLFAERYLIDNINLRKDLLENDVKEIKREEILVGDLNKIVEDIGAKFEYHVPVINEDKISRYKEQETDSGVAYTVFVVPFEGDSYLFRFQPVSVKFGEYPHGQVYEGELHITCMINDIDKDALMNDFTQQLDEIKNRLNIIKKDVAKFNADLKPITLNLLNQRKDKLTKDKEIFDAIPYPMQIRNDTPIQVPIEQKKINVQQHAASSVGKEAEHYLDMDDYNRILYVISCMATVMERCPDAFEDMNEEHIRHHFLIPLNALYEGQATGETFNLYGKTDILIRVAGKNVFIAECKFWTGESGFKETISQLLKYTSFRDTKTAVIMFSKNNDFSEVLKQIPVAVKSHDNYIKELGQTSKTEFKYEFHHNDDNERKLILTVMMFNMPKKEKHIAK